MPTSSPPWPWPADLAAHARDVAEQLALNLLLGNVARTALRPKGEGGAYANGMPGSHGGSWTSIA